MKNKATILFTFFVLILTSQVSNAQWTTGTDIHNTNSGNVGIGTSSPQDGLSVANPSATVGLYRDLGGSTPSVNNVMGSLYFGLFNPTTSITTKTARINGITTQIWTTGTVQGTGLAFLTTKNGTASAAETMRLDDSGNLGLGTTSPVTHLSVNSNANATGSLDLSNSITIGSLNANATSKYLGQFGFLSNDDSFTSPKTVAYISGEATETYDGNSKTGSAMRFFTGSNGGTSAKERMVIDNNGYLGLGATSPVNHLSVNSNGNATGDIDLSNSITIGSLNANSSSKYLGQFGFLSNDDSFSAPKIVAYISGEATETYDANTKTGSAMRFFTGSNGGTNATERMVIDNNGNVGVGTKTPDKALTVKGTIHASEVLVDLSVPTPDYVFNSDYKLPTLNEVKAFIDANHHLQNVPSAAEVEKDGLKLGEMNTILLKKVEELTLYLIQKDQNEKKQEVKIKQLEQRLDELSKKLN